MIATILSWLLVVYNWVLIIRVIGSWIEFATHGMPAALQPIWRGVLVLTDPPLRWLGRWIKPVRLGDMMLDLAIVVLFILVWVAQRLVLFLPF